MCCCHFVKTFICLLILVVHLSTYAVVGVCIVRLCECWCRCPYAGCGNLIALTMEDLIENAELRAHINKQLAAAEEQTWYNMIWWCVTNSWCDDWWQLLTANRPCCLLSASVGNYWTSVWFSDSSRLPASLVASFQLWQVHLSLCTGCVELFICWL